LSGVDNLANILNGYKILTLTYREVPTHQLEQLVLANDLQGELFGRLELIKKNLGLNEIFYLHTCNRILYFFHSDSNLDINLKLRFFRHINPSLTQEQFQYLVEKVKFFEGERAITHLFEVAGSIDSMVVGEREILRQLRTAYEECALQGTTGDYIRLAMQQAVRTAKKIYNDTRIGEKPISIVSLSIKALLERNPLPSDRILLLGAGQTMNLVCKFLRKHGLNNVSIANRTLAKAENLMNGFTGSAFSLDQLSEYKKGFDVLITCTGHNSSWVNGPIYHALLQEESDHKIVIDLAVPNNLNREVIQGYNMDYIEVEDLRKIAQENLAFRAQEVDNAREILQLQYEEFKISLHQRKIERAMKDIPSQIKAIKSKAIQEVFKKDLENLDEQSLTLVHRMMDYMEKKCISIPMKAAKKAATNS